MGKEVNSELRHLGDICKLNGAEIPMVDVICGGSPCQDLSVAGKRAGLAGARSGLFMEQIRLIKEMRDECIKQLCMRGTDFSGRDIRPRYMVWENVPGAFSSNGGEDFRAVLEETARIVCEDAVIPEPSGRWTPSGCIMGDGWSIAWRVHDAQFWGVPQRRKRIALVADFGGESAPEILFERQGVSGDPEQSAEEGEEITGAARESADKAISFQERAGCDGGARESLSSVSGQEPCLRLTTNPYAASSGIGGGGGLEALCIGNGQANDAAQPDGVCKALNCMHDGMAVLTIDQGGGKSSVSVSEDISPTLATTHQGEPAVCYGLDRASFNQGQNAKYDFSIEEEIAQTIVSRGPGGVTQLSVHSAPETTKE